MWFQSWTERYRTVELVCESVLMPNSHTKWISSEELISWSSGFLNLSSLEFFMWVYIGDIVNSWKSYRLGETELMDLIDVDMIRNTWSLLRLLNFCNPDVLKYPYIEW